uniref:Fibrinogen C-terminal domain-containing protein n=1 Tax=Strigamia maritima TaxID=126957 RepID=T1IQG4_STRMM
MEFKYECEGSIYYMFPTWPPITKIVCEEPMIGRYVVIKKLQACEGMDTCPLSHLPLSLCEVEVQGYYYEFNETNATNIALNSIVKQSGTVKPAGLAIDGIYEIEPMEIKTPLCAIVVKDNLIGPLWILKLPKPFKIAQINIYTNETNIDNLGVSTMSPFSTACHPSEKQQSDALTFICNKELDSGGAFIRLNHRGSLALCEVEVLAVDQSDSVNVALGKPTNQSSIEYNAGGHLAVDGRITQMFYPGYGRWIAQCTHTTEGGDEYPWWRVDLLQEYIISSVYIYNRGETLHSRLHDIEVRIGNHDVVDYAESGEFRFRSNPLCYSNFNSFLLAGANIITCPQDLVGRFVSIQIVRLCSLSSCHWSAAERNILTLCEVEVYGDVIVRESLIEKNLASDVTVQHSLDVDISITPELLLDGHVDVHSDDHPWLLIDLTSKHVVDRIVLVVEKDEHGNSPVFDIRVGNEKISGEYISEFFRKNMICYQMINGYLESGVNTFKCHHPLVGRYVSLQVMENCTTISCITGYERIVVSSSTVEVWGYFYHEIKPLVNIAFHAATRGIDYVIGNSSLTVDGIFPSMIFQTEVVEQCAETDDINIYPWFQIELKNLSFVQSIGITLPGNGHNLKLHDFEIRVGFNDLTDIGLDEPFTDNALCFKSDNKTYAEGFNKFPCTLPIIGNFITIQIVEKRYNPILHEDDKNVLQLCEVQVLGYPSSETVQIQNLSLKKSTIQSSTEGDGVSSLANNGVSEIGIISTAHFQSCTENIAAQCTIDTSQLKDCSEIYNKGCKQSGVYILSYENDVSNRVFYSVYCDMETDGGGWTVFQRRDKSLTRKVHFDNSWVSYREGFGNLCGEFWLGNHFIHNFGDGLTMRIDLTVGEESKVIVSDSFSIDDEANNFTAHAFYFHSDVDIGIETINGKPFQTYDRKSGKDVVDCGWWLSDDVSQP